MSNKTTKKVIKPELIADNSNGKIKVKLHFEDTEKKPPSQLKVTDAPAAAVRRQLRREIRESEDDNVGVEAADAEIPLERQDALRQDLCGLSAGKENGHEACADSHLQTGGADCMA